MAIFTNLFPRRKCYKIQEASWQQSVSFSVDYLHYFVVDHPQETTNTSFQATGGPNVKTDYLVSWTESAPRPVAGSLRRCLQGLGHKHNDMGKFLHPLANTEIYFVILVNIYSHLVGSSLFLTLPIYTYHKVYLSYPSADWMDVLVFSTFHFGVAACFFLSA